MKCYFSFLNISLVFSPIWFREKDMAPQKKRRLNKFWQTIIVLLFLTVIGNLIIWIATPYRALNVFLLGSCYSILCGYPLYRGFKFIGIKLDEKIPWLKNPLKRLFVGLGLQIALLLVVVLLVSMLALYLTTGELNFQSTYTQTKNSFIIGLTCTIVATLIVNGVYFFIKWKEAAVSEEQLKREALALQFDALKNQVSPHFLFNSLSALTTMIRNDPGNAIQFVDQLSSVYRYLLEHKDKEIIDLNTEMAFLESYIHLYKIRHGDNLNVSFMNMEKAKGSVITLSLQMLVENAIKHNEISSELPLRIEIEKTGDGYIWVRNNLQLRSSVLAGKKVGLENISTRYRLLSNKEVKIINGPDKFEVGLPLLPDVKK